MGLGFGPSGLAPQPDAPASAHARAYRHALEPLRQVSPSGLPQANFPSPTHDRRPD